MSDIEEALFREMSTPRVGVYYVSFADEMYFRGGCFVQAIGSVAALAVAHAVGCNPGGEAMVFGPVLSPGKEWMDRLLTREEVENIPDPEGADSDDLPPFKEGECPV